MFLPTKLIFSPEAFLANMAIGKSTQLVCGAAIIIYFFTRLFNVELKDILSNYWGRISFKENQEPILNNLINGKSIIADYTSISE